jgi:hypothetical protein
MDQLDIFAKRAQWANLACLAIVANEGEQGDSVFLRENAQEMVRSQAIPSRGWVWQASG